MTITLDLWQILGILVFVAGLFDAQKYRDLTKKIKKYKSTKGQSRMFTNKAIIMESLPKIIH